MEIQYLQKLKENKKIGSEIIKGLSKEHILEAEEKLDVKFPLAYKEFLYLAGSYSGNLHMLETDQLEMLSLASARLSRVTVKIIKKTKSYSLITVAFVF
ncbi:SMI1/KNR4 family protein [Psychroserpens luteus]|uniref:SMI1/KNR4 family protein n=1 Tax=Psychroserpens luteus TaxID=1434066 RepID=A0ABW5ZVZ7_9FLAO|nr:SMI1/KNR4 family protein [Psychroserpens luteus]